MSDRKTTMEPLRVLVQFPFRGVHWQSSLVIGTALVLAGSVLPIVPLVFVYGYALRVMRRIIQGHEPELPAWDDWGRLGLDGLGGMLVGLVYTLPGTLVMFGGWVLYMVVTFVSSAVLSTGDEAGMILFPVVLMISMAVMFLSILLGMVLMLAGLAPLPMALAEFAAGGRLADAFRLDRLWRIMRGNWLDYVLAWLLAGGLLAALYTALMLVYSTLVLCCLLPLLFAPALFYLLLINAALFARVYRDSLPEAG